MRRKPHVTFYTKPGCHLCEEAKREIVKAGSPEEYTFEEVNILSDPDLQRRYGMEIPVVLINATHVFKYSLTADDFRRALRRFAQYGER
jgi:glutaredoxin